MERNAGIKTTGLEKKKIKLPGTTKKKKTKIPPSQTKRLVYPMREN